MKSNYLALIALLFPIAVTAQDAPTEAFRQWATQHVHTIASVETDTADNADLRPLREIVGGAHVLALGEPFHGGHEPLAMRNRLIRYAVTQLGFKSVALETNLTTSKRIYDHVLGKTTETDAALTESFSFRWGEFPENIELIQWLRNHNAAQPPASQVHFYGIDMAQRFPNAYRSVGVVLNFVDHAKPNLGHALHKQFADVLSLFESDKYAKLAPAEKDAITAKIQDLNALMRRERVELTAVTSSDEYEWALRESLNAAQDDVFMRTLPPEFDPEQFDHNPGERQSELRDLAMADNLMWVQQRESSRGKTFFFAHDGHVSASVVGASIPTRPDMPGDNLKRPTGMYLRSVFGRDMVVIGTWWGHGAGLPPSVMTPPNTAGMDGLLSSISIPLFIMDLRELPGAGILRQWFQATHEAQSGPFFYKSVPAEAYDAILFIEAITPTPPVPKR